ncbi:SIS domain-containing protein [Radicibacter daui]|uniref:SIS domain-containing protein n=1 Tax=Radicibacter daui TaxID=3064829 RepID=UPI0040469D59
MTSNVPVSQSQMVREALSVSDVAATALGRNAALFAEAAERIRRFDPLMLVTVARGSSDNASEYISRLAAARLGLLPASLPPAVVTVDGAALRADRAVVIAVSQSGRSPDLIAPVEALRKAGALTIALVNHTDSPLAAASDIVLPVDAGEEKAVAATKSFIMTLIQGARLIAEIGKDTAFAGAISALPPLLDAAMKTDWSAALGPLAAARSPFVVGRGLGYAIARETALKFKEVCGLHAEGISGAEIMHGPKALIGPTDPVLAFAPADNSRKVMEAAIRDLGALTSGLIAVGAPTKGAATAISLPAAPAPELATILAGASSYPFIADLAIARGLSPDEPRNLKKVTETL